MAGATVDHVLKTGPVPDDPSASKQPQPQPGRASGLSNLTLNHV
jgi:hypothetical protein